MEQEQESEGKTLRAYGWKKEEADKAKCSIAKKVAPFSCHPDI